MRNRRRARDDLEARVVGAEPHRARVHELAQHADRSNRVERPRDGAERAGRRVLRPFRELGEIGDFVSIARQHLEAPAQIDGRVRHERARARRRLPLARTIDGRTIDVDEVDLSKVRAEHFEVDVVAIAGPEDGQRFAPGGLQKVRDLGTVRREALPARRRRAVVLRMKIEEPMVPEQALTSLLLTDQADASGSRARRRGESGATCQSDRPGR
jgi:hypothetical protein